MSRVRLGLRENLGQFSLLVVVNAFVGAMVGLERTVLVQASGHGCRSKSRLVRASPMLCSVNHRCPSWLWHLEVRWPGRCALVITTISGYRPRESSGLSQDGQSFQPNLSG